MGLSGLFLVSFLLIHLLGNLQLFAGDGGAAFNAYTRFMSTNPLIKVLEWVLFGGFIIHILYATMLTIKNNAARGTKYVKRSNAGASWFSRNMFITGSVIFIFLVVHLISFWGKYHFSQNGEPTTVKNAYEQSWKILDASGVNGLDALLEKHYLTDKGYADLKAHNAQALDAQVRGHSMYQITKASFQHIGIVLLYVIAMILLGLHLAHGFQSSFRTMGWVHDKYMPMIKILGYAMAVLFPLLFAAMPLYFLFGMG